MLKFLIEITMLDDTFAFIDELNKAEISFCSKLKVFEYSLLDLEEEIEFMNFNGACSIAEYRNRIIGLYNHSKIELSKLTGTNGQQNIDDIRIVQSKLAELNLVFNPSNEEMIFSHVVIKEINDIEKRSIDLLMLKKKRFNI